MFTRYPKWIGDILKCFIVLFLAGVIYDRVRKQENIFKIPAFLMFEQGTHRAGKFQQILSGGFQIFKYLLYYFEKICAIHHHTHKNI